MYYAVDMFHSIWYETTDRKLAWKFSRMISVATHGNIELQVIDHHRLANSLNN